MTYIVDQEVINPYGICTGEGLPRENYTPYVDYSFNYNLTFYSYLGENYDIGPSPYEPTSNWRFDNIGTIAGNYIRQVHNLSNDTYIDVDLVQTFFHSKMTSSIDQRTFETEAEALEYVDTLGNPTPIATIHRNEVLFTATWRQQVDGIWINRDTTLQYTGDDISLYTTKDLVNFFALFFEVTPEEIDVVHRPTIRIISLPTDYDYSLDAPPPLIFPSPPTVLPTLDCDPYIKAAIIDIEGSTDPIEINIDFDRDIVYDDGSGTIADNGNINMSNDGGTLFLNEFGNAGIYANNDASLTADNQVQLGVGGTTLTIDSDGFTFRDSTGTALLTAEDLDRIMLELPT